MLFRVAANGSRVSNVATNRNFRTVRAYQSYCLLVVSVSLLLIFKYKTMKAIEILKILSNSKAIMWVAIVELVLQATLYVLGSTIAKWHFIGWLIWLIISTCCRIYFYRTVRFYNER